MFYGTAAESEVARPSIVAVFRFRCFLGGDLLLSQNLRIHQSRREAVTGNRQQWVDFCRSPAQGTDGDPSDPTD